MTKSRRQVEVSNPLAPVRISPVRVNGDFVSQKGIEILNDDGIYECLNIHSAQYNLIPNALVQDVTEEILAESDMEWNKVKDVWTGRYWARLYNSDASIEVPTVGDTVSLGLRVQNSYDGSCQFSLVLMAYVLSCENGLVVPKHFTSYKMRHTANNSFNIPEAVNVLKTGMEELEALVPRIDTLSYTPLTTSLISQVAKETNLPKREWGFIIESLGEADNAWDLMQAITHRLSHHGRGRSGLLYQEAVGDYFLDTLVKRRIA